MTKSNTQDSAHRISLKIELIQAMKKCGLGVRDQLIVIAGKSKEIIPDTIVPASKSTYAWENKVKDI